MELVLFIIFLILSLVLVALGLYFSQHTELALIGFVFLFLLSFPIISENINYETGKQINSTFNYTTSVGNLTLLTSSYEIETKVYTSIFADSDLSHYFGYWLAVISMVGFIGVIIDLRHSLGYK